MNRPATHSPVFDELRAVQRTHGYLPEGELRALADRLDLPLYALQSVASFYPHFFLKPPARVEARVCGDMSCHRYGGNALRESLARRFQGQDVNVQHVSCLGRCDLAPAIAVNDEIYERVDEAGAASLILTALGGQPLPAHSHTPPASIASDPYAGGAQYGVLREYLQSRDWTGMIAKLKESGLRGLGGAGFPTGLKWEIVRAQPGPEKFIVCNADESEPGTIKDRFIMTHAPHLVIEGMILGGLVSGARHGIFYIRHEYTEQEHIIAAEIRRCYREGLLGASLLGTDLGFDLEVFVSPGLYICGEESALLEAIEGKRAEPRNKPPFPGQQGLWHQPTVINNVETFFFVPVILARGLEWLKAQGRNGAVGVKFVGVSGDVRYPGVFEVPMGTTYRELIEQHAGGVPPGRTIKSYAPSGPAGGYLPASMLDLPLDWNAMTQAGATVGSGAIVVCDDRACMLDMALNAVRFFRNESCGKCVPCRTGSQKLVDILTSWTQGSRGPDDLALYEELSHALRLTSICGLGQVVPVPIASVMKHFRDEVEAHVRDRVCPAGVCAGLGARAGGLARV
ncbi:MAG TPA: NADH-ubiquinone oxidoreductase-F iron-sulfur binding region domain-containing protein [Vicinamibacterales bacterium]|nr:NADH-ubiquinone oxidoreductase-F iron-sulfur binding region domain-containing protein [Vicinamibacterales bacterium]